MNKRKIMIAANIIVTTAAATMLAYLWFDGFIVREDIRRATQQCTEEVQQGCPLLYEYSSLLERQNASLNMRVKECDVLIPDAGAPPSDTGR